MLDPRPKQILEVLNEALLEHDPSGARFCTAICGVLDVGPAGAVSLRLARGGHPPALVARASGISTATPGGRLLGAFADPALEDETIALAPGDTVVLHTDGLTDVGHDSDVLGADWVRATLARHRGESAAVIADRLADGALALQSSSAGRDDIAVLAIAVPAAASIRAA
jgi:sigma-B regulation protein RsbU (phosphoserine phosphatase)